MTPSDQFRSLPSRLRLADAQPQIRGEDFKDYDQFPVKDPAGKVIGLAFRTDVAQGDHADTVRAIMRGFVHLPPIEAGEPLGKAVGQLRSTPARLVWRNGTVVGLVHKSDYNRTIARAAFYLEIAATEVAIQSLIRKIYAKDEWMGLLDKRRRKDIRRRRLREKSDRANVDLTEYTCLSDLLDVVTRDTAKHTWSVLACSSLYDWKSATKGLEDFRNRVMHPVRSLVARSQSLDLLHERHGQVQELLQRLRVTLE